MNIRRKLDRRERFHGFALFTITTNGMISVDMLPVHIRTIDAAVRNLRDTAMRRRNRRGCKTVNGLRS